MFFCVCVFVGDGFSVVVVVGGGGGFIVSFVVIGDGLDDVVVVAGRGLVGVLRSLLCGRRRRLI